MQILNFDLDFRLSWLEIAKKLLLQVVDIFDGYKCAKYHKSTISASVGWTLWVNHFTVGQFMPEMAKASFLYQRGSHRKWKERARSMWMGRF